MDERYFLAKVENIKQQFRRSESMIGADFIEFTLVSKRLSGLKARFDSGKPITGKELQEISDHWKSKNPLIDEEGNAFVLYIPDWQFSFKRGRMDSQNVIKYKYHVTWCKTLDFMKKSGRSDRYIKKSDIENNVFKGKIENDENVSSVLYACGNCKKEIESKFGPEAYFEVEEMDLLYFFSLYGNRDLPDNGNDSPYSVIYPKHWRNISQKYREENNWCCSECKKSFINKKHLLDVHHINGIRSDVSKTNLKVLCRDCHANQPLHGHYARTLKK